ncbi:TlpA disulfide reductase family protein [Siminovitchia sp. FSL H7-0308]|uniref:Peroxiredoxin n=1 Tax=Siminovitchia thermophila TaxID=1245522 RepID=A0ABS2R6I6_9BACI|nr:TlpA disulfide reductase family protein [Siminovitchia thermophila]MBM7715272.1 peroxiredoxin [Siminovitchia thermophila]ONK24009.1 hypothetical protein BLX87_07120 [Bacillus sp. VT-16-64]
MKEKMIMSLIMFSIGLFLIGHFSEDREKQTSTAPEGVGHLPGQRAPDFRLKTDGGEELSLADLKGKHVFINFWASWCPPCRAEMPHIQNFFEENKEENIALLSVNLLHLEKNKEAVRTFSKQNELSFPIVFDETGEVSNTYQAQTIPTSYVVDKEGVIRHKIVGPVSKERLRRIFTELDE